MARSRSLLGSSSLALLLAAALPACSLEPLNGDTFTGSTVGRLVSFEGYATVAGASITIDVLDPADQDPRDPASHWTRLASTTAGTQPLYWTSSDPLYEWDLNATPVPDASQTDRWPSGGLARLRVQQNGSNMITFDDDACIGENLFEPVDTIALRCASHDSGILTLVDKDPVPDAGANFLSLTRTDIPESRQYYAQIGAGPGQPRETFGGWLAANGFDPVVFSHTIKIGGAPAPPEIDVPRDISALRTRAGGGPSVSGPIAVARRAPSQLAGSNLTLAQVSALHSSGQFESVRSSGLAVVGSATATLPGNAVATGSIIATFHPPQLTPVSAIYRNAGDLGFGREMHCRQKEDGGAACYVTNYGGFDVPAITSIADALAHRDPIATVAMEYLPSGTNRVRFYVYDGFGALLRDAVLDSEDDVVKPVPGVCLTCHQGSYNPSTDTVTGARFLPFDLDSFEYTTTVGYRRADQEQAFRKLNRIVRDTNPTPAMSDLIDGWYAPNGVYSETAVFDGSYVPSGWSSESTLYREVVKPYCRTCHAANAANTGIDFLSFSGFAARPIEYYVCDEKLMPHAELTFQKFWNSPARAHLAGALGLATSCN